MHGTNNTSASHHYSASRDPFSVSEPVRVKRSSFQGGPPALRHLLRSPLGNGEVFLGSQQPGASSAM